MMTGEPKFECREGCAVDNNTQLSVGLGLDQLPRRESFPFFEQLSLPAGFTEARRLTGASCVTLVIKGEFDDLSQLGRHRVREGTLIVRPTFGSRAAAAIGASTVILDLPWRTELSGGAIYDHVNIEDLAALALKRPASAVRTAQAIVLRGSPRCLVALRWPHALAAALRSNPSLKISDWARANGKTSEAVARGFQREHQVGPARFRFELRARQAWRRILTTSDPLSIIAIEAGFFDQAHMTHAVKWLTGSTPAEWRLLRPH